MSVELLEFISPEAARFVCKHGMRIGVSHYDEQSFGNAFVEVACPEFELRVVRDRCQVFLDIRPVGQTEWRSLSEVLEFLGHSIPWDSTGALLAGVSGNFGDVAGLMASDLDAAGFTELERLRGVRIERELLRQSGLAGTNKRAGQGPAHQQ